MEFKVKMPFSHISIVVLVVFMIIIIMGVYKDHKKQIVITTKESGNMTIESQGSALISDTKVYIITVNDKKFIVINGHPLPY
jgi:hypothetical protein